MSTDPKNFSTIAERLKFVRDYRNLSQGELGEALGVTRAAVALWEAGKRNMEDGRLQQIADLLGVTWRYLAQGDEAFDPLFPGTNGFVNKLPKSTALLFTDVSKGQQESQAPNETQGDLSPAKQLALDVLQDDLRGLDERIREMSDDEAVQLARAIRKALEQTKR